MAVTGAGTVSNPYVLTEPADLDFARSKPASNYRLANDLDMSTYGVFEPIGALSPAAKRFSGSFNGDGFKIKNLKIRATGSYTGFIGVLVGGGISNLAIVDADIISTGAAVGGVVGLNSGGDVSNCYSSGMVQGATLVGGIAGYVEGVIENCFSFAHVTGTTDVYGIGGMGSPLTSRVNNSHFYGTIESGDIKRGITSDIATNGNRSNNCFYDSETTGLSVGVGTALSTAEMKNPTNFYNWNSSIWTFEVGKYPYLTSLGEPLIKIPANKRTVTMTSEMEALTSSLQRRRRKVVVSVTHTPVLSPTLSKQAVKNVMSMIEDITSNVEVLENANIKTHIISSHIEGNGSSAIRIVKAVRRVGSVIQPLNIVTQITIPMQIEKPVFAEVWFIENQSAVSQSHNKTSISLKENATETSVI